MNKQFRLKHSYTKLPEKEASHNSHSNKMTHSYQILRNYWSGEPLTSSSPSYNLLYIVIKITPSNDISHKLYRKYFS